MLLNLLGILLALYCGLSCGDRLRQINFHNAKALNVAMYVAFVCWCIGVANDAWGDSLDWYQLLGLFALVCLLRVTKESWRAGPPPSVTKPAPLSAETRTFAESKA